MHIAVIPIPDLLYDLFEGVPAGLFCLELQKAAASALGIVGALILGQAAVSASIISPILIIIVAITGLGNYAVPDYGFSIGLIICRLFVILCGATLGLFGICLAGFALTAALCGMTSLGFPYLAPVAPHRPHNPDILARAPLRMQRIPLFYAQNGGDRAS